MVRDATLQDRAAILRLNQGWLKYLSTMDEARFEKLARSACYFRVVEEGGNVAAFLLAFRKGASYDGFIFGLFQSHAEDFIYLDRIVVDTAFQGRRIADRLYDDVSSFARSIGVHRLLCEVDFLPPNEISLRLHAKRGFHMIGQQLLPGGTKTVALLQLDLAN